MARKTRKRRNRLLKLPDSISIAGRKKRKWRICPKCSNYWPRKLFRKCPMCEAEKVRAEILARNQERLEPLDEVPWDRQPNPIPPASVPDLLRRAAATYEARNKVYGDNYKQHGKVLDALFPRGLTIKAGDAAALNRLGLLNMLVAKLGRYCQNPNGHKDSAHDGSVYFAMLEELTPS